MLTIFLGIGIFLEDYAKGLVSSRARAIPGLTGALSLLLPAESSLRLAVLFDAHRIPVEQPHLAKSNLTDQEPRTGPRTAFVDTCDKYFASNDKKDDLALPVYGRQGDGSLDLGKYGISAFAKHLLAHTLANEGILDSVSPVKPDQLRSLLLRLCDGQCGWERPTGDDPLRCSGLWPLIDLYYWAKNTVYLNDNYFAELTAIESRTTFSRAMTLTTGLAILLVLFACPVRLLIELGRWRKRRGKAKGELGPSEGGKIVIAILLLISACWGMRETYVSEEFSFNMRVLGYFDSATSSSHIW